MISKPVTRGKSPKLITDDWRWQALVRKDERADGLFWYSVKTTGVYCRPSCPARLPNRENVAFHESPQNAEKAGFRACKRCGPKGPGLAGQHAEAVTTACRMIKEADEFPSLNQLAEAVKMSPGYFHRLFKTATGLTPKDYANAHRADRIKRALPKRETVTQAIYDAGFNSNGRFYAGSSKMLGMKPKEYREGGTGNTIRFAIAECSLGSILVASSEKGVCAILMGDDPEALARDLQDQFPKANLIGGDDRYEKLVAKVSWLHRGSENRIGPAFGYSRHRLPTARLERASTHPCREHRQLFRSGEPDRFPQFGAGCRAGLRRERTCGGHSLPPSRS